MISVKEEQANQEIAKHVAEVLNKAYYGHAWAVNANVMDGVVRVHNLNLSGEWGFILHIDTLINDPSDKPIVMAGGELLERFRLSRGCLNESELEHAKRDLRGAVIHDT